MTKIRKNFDDEIGMFILSFIFVRLKFYWFEIDSIILSLERTFVKSKKNKRM